MQPLLSVSGWHGLTVMEERNDSTDFCSSNFPGDVHSDHHRSMGKTYCYAGMCASYIDSCIRNLYAQPSAIIETLNIHSIFHRDSGTQQVKQAKLLLESTGKLSCSSLV